MGRWIRTGLELTIILSLLPGLALAQPQEKKEARLAFKGAQQAYSLGQFDEALGLFSEAYRLDPQPATLFNLGQCNRHLGNHERAIFYFNRYLESFNGNPKNAKQVRALVAEAESKLAQQQKRLEEEKKAAREKEMEMIRYAAARAESEANANRPEGSTPADAPRATAAEPFVPQLPPNGFARAEPTTTTTTTTKLKEEKSIVTRWWFWAAVGGAAAAVGTGAYIATSPQPRQTTLGTRTVR